ncbi:MAG: hypothetical protein JRI72_13785, partial [Deltaproteobacteria bacterium]|nr:hypothetical protein [Deltaproteobacteria bacterium]
MADPRYFYWSNILTGGGDYALDKIDGADLNDLNASLTIQADTSFIHVLDADNAGSEASPSIIAPDTNAGDKRWVHIGMTFPNTGLKILDTNASNELTITPGSDLTADRTLTLTTGDADRTITLSGNPTLADWFDQAVKQTSSPTFDDLTLSNPSNIYALSHDSFSGFVANEHIDHTSV